MKIELQWKRKKKGNRKECACKSREQQQQKRRTMALNGNEGPQKAWEREREGGVSYKCRCARSCLLRFFFFSGLSFFFLVIVVFFFSETDCRNTHNVPTQRDAHFQTNKHTYIYICDRLKKKKKEPRQTYFFFFRITVGVSNFAQQIQSQNPPLFFFSYLLLCSFL